MNQSKPKLRSALKQARQNMGVNEHLQKSEAILSALKEVIDWSAAKTVHCFEPIDNKKEVDIVPVIDFLRAHQSQIFVPRLVEGEWRVYSLDASQNSTPFQFDVVITPMLGFDPMSLQRIGYGGGYYDKLLATQPSSKKIGVCFEQGKISHLPTEPHDMPLDIIVTEMAVYKK